MGHMVVVMFNGRLVARSNRTVVVEGNHYFPPGDVDDQYLHPSRAKSLCPWKGIASYYALDVDGEHLPNAAWTYRHPSPCARRIKNHVAFWGGVEILDEPAAES